MSEGLIANSCGIDDLYADPDVEFFLSYGGDGTFTIPREEADDLDCSIAAEDFVCPNRLSGMLAVNGVPITVVWQTRIDGTFTSAAAMTGVKTLTFSCEGDSCDLAGLAGITFPCSYQYAFSATKA